MRAPNTDTLRNALDTIEQESKIAMCATHTDQYETVHVFVADETQSHRKLYTLQHFAAPDVMGLPEDVSKPMLWPELLATLAYYEIDVLNGWILTRIPAEDDGEMDARELLAIRTEHGTRSLAFYVTLSEDRGVEPDYQLSDLIASLLHHAAALQISIPEILARALHHFEEERMEAGLEALPEPYQHHILRGAEHELNRLRENARPIPVSQ